MAYLSQQDLLKAGAKPLFEGEPGNLPGNWSIQGGESVPTNVQQYRDEQGLHYLGGGGAPRPVQDIKYQLPTGEIFQYREPKPGIGYSISGNFEQISGNPYAGGASQTPEQLLTSGQYRDVPGNLIQNIQSGSTSLASGVQGIQQTPQFNPNSGPQVNTGQGNVSLTPAQQQQLGQGVPLNQVLNPPPGNMAATATPNNLTFASQPAGNTPAGQPQGANTAITQQQYQMTPQEASSGAMGVQQYVQRIAGLRGDSQQFQQDIIQKTAAEMQKLQGQQQQQQQQQAQQKAIDNLATNHGITATPEDFNTNPIKATGDLFQKLYENLGLKDLKTQVSDIEKETKTLDDKYAQQIMEVNENPWLSEALRSKKVGLLKEKYDTQKSQLVDRATLYQTKFERGLDEAKFVATQSLEAFYKEKTLDQNLLIKQMELAQKQSEASGVVGEYQDALRLGYIPKGTSLSSFVDQRKADNLNTQVVEVGGKKVLINSKTGAKISDLGPSSSGSNDAATASAAVKITGFLLKNAGPDHYVTPDNYKKARDAWLQDFAGNSKAAESFDARFGNFVNPQKAQEYGIKWKTGAPSSFEQWLQTQNTQ